MDKKPWVVPELILVERARLEESVLQGCKTYRIAGPVTVGSGCFCGSSTCQPCHAATDS